MTSRQLILLLVVLVGVGILFTMGRLLMQPATGVPTPTSTNEPVACTMDAKICPDGSAVGRVGPNCEFAQCPLTSTTTPVTSFTGVIGQKVGTVEISIIPRDVLEDSRCGINVVCIQAGTVRLQAEVIAATTSMRTFELNKPLTLGNRTITLVEVQPAAYAGRDIGDNDYRFRFEIK